MKTIKGGLYLVIDPKPGIKIVAPQVEAAIKGGVDVLQIWDHWQSGQDAREFVETICEMALPSQVPVLVNESIDLLYTTSVDGIHFDQPPVNPEKIRQEAGQPILTGLTCGNDLNRVKWAVGHQFDYISFCAMFPSSSAGACEIVTFDTVEQARKMGNIPIFASGGVTPENLGQLMTLGVNGVAVISGILKATDPEEAARNYKKLLSTTSKY